MSLQSIDLPESAPALISGHLRMGGTNPAGEKLEVNSYYVTRNGVPFIPVMGEFHFSRYPARYWRDELLKIKAGGVDIVATYVFWIHVEEDEGVFDWSGNNDLRRFVELCASVGLQAVVRMGPFAHGECRNGGIPDWLYGRPFPLRSNDERYLAYVRRLYGEIAAQLTGLLYKEGGPVVGVQLDNEYMHCGAPWEVTFKPGTEWVPAGSEGASHILTLKQIAIEAGLDVPFYTCTGWLRSPVPEGEVLPMQGGYAFTPWSPDPAYVQPPTREFIFRNRHLDPVLNGSPTYDASRVPFACCEIGGGIQDTYYHRNIVPPQSVEALAVMNLAGGANLIGYYMYHGGTNPVGKHSFMNEFTVPRRSYDFQAPLREYGQAADSYRSLRLLHQFLHDFGDVLAPMQVTLPANASAITPEDTGNLRYAVRSDGGAGFLFLNNYQDHVETQDISGIQFRLNLPDETLTIPSDGTLMLQKETSAILPFGLSLAGIRLNYATVQLLARVDDGEAVNFFFFAVPGMTAEYAFDPRTYAAMSTLGDTSESAGQVRVTAVIGLDYPITLTAHDGRIVRLFTLTRHDAEIACKLHVEGQDRLVISDATVYADDGKLVVSSIGQNEVSLLIFPPLENALMPSSGTAAQHRDRFFTRCAITLPAQSLQLGITPIDDARVSVSVPSVAPGNVCFYLHVSYVGDIANCFINGKLAADQFYNGSTWEIGLKHLIEGENPAELLFLITPIRQQSGTSSFVPTGMAFRLNSDAETIGMINSITAVPEYTLTLQV